MSDYLPIDLAASCNTDAKALGLERLPTTGLQAFLGIPFQISESNGAAAYIGFGPPPMGSGTITIAVEAAAHNIVFAHALLDTQIHEGDPPGRVVATYTFVYTDSVRVVSEIRERFEISVVPVAWGEHPFLAMPDQPDGLMDRFQGEWGQTGFRQTEARQAWPRDYYLWSWRNPRPETMIDHVEIAAVDTGQGASQARLIVAGITLGQVDEEPFRRTAGVPVMLTLPNKEDAAAPFALSVSVDRGVATFPFSLPEKTDDEFLQDTHAGWGEKQNTANSPSYVEIAATPSATVTIKKGDETLAAANWGELEKSGLVETERVRIEVVDTGRNWVHTTVLDDETGKPVPCRVHFRTPSGIPYAPHGHHAHVNSNLGTWHIDVGGDVRLGQVSYAYIDGKCQGWLPRGEVIVDVARGYEYEPLRERVSVQPGQRALELRLKRRENLNKERYFSGDTHVHFLSTQGSLTEAAAEDLDVVNLLLSQWGHLFTNSEEFTGRSSTAHDGETIVYASQENRQHLLGHLTLLGLKEPVMPWCSDGPSEAELGGNLETTLSYWADACHAQGGTVVIPHLPNPNAEPAALIATGRADSVEMLIHSPFFHLEYYRYLNGGYRLPLSGGTDKMDSGVPVGMYRTYAYIPPDEPFTYDNWCKALRSGNTFLSGGPMLRFTVDGKPIGSTLTLGNTGGTVEVEAVATSIFPIHSLEIVRGSHRPSQCEVVASTEDAKGVKELRVRAKVRIEDSTWLCARCAGPGYSAVKHHDSWQRGIMAHTSPVYLECGKREIFSPATMHYMLTLLDGSLQYIRNRAPQWKPGTVTHHHGEHDHMAFLERPFHEAIAAVHKKLHQHGIAH